MVTELPKLFCISEIVFIGLGEFSGTSNLENPSAIKISLTLTHLSRVSPLKIAINSRFLLIDYTYHDMLLEGRKVLRFVYFQ